MIRFFGLMLLSANVGIMNAQIVDSINSISLDEVIVTSNRRSEPLSTLTNPPVIINSTILNTIPAVNFDDIFIYSPGLNQDRKNGIYTGSGVVVNGMGITGGEQGRFLVLEDGIPLNISDNGDVNWNRLEPSEYQRVEIIKGPASNLYGSNAMAGMINLVTATPVNPVEIRARFNYGSFQIGKAYLKAGGRKNNFFWNTALSHNRGKGYIMPPDSLRDSTDIATSLFETRASVNVGYVFKSSSKLSASYHFYDDKHGYGIQLREPGGGYTSHKTNIARIGFIYDNRSWFGNVNLYYQSENYYKLIEKLRDTIYTVIDVNSDRYDAGLLAFGGKRLDFLTISIGGDFRSGKTDAIDDYRTSSDEVLNSGVILQYSGYFQAETEFFKSKLKLGVAINYTGVTLTGSSFSINNPTSETAYMSQFAAAFHDTTWTAVNPSANLRFIPSQEIEILFFYSHGFRTPTIDDLSRSGMINIGFKEANPGLKPEKIDYYGITLNFKPLKSLFISPLGYYSKGNDYIYYKPTGETLFGGRRMVYRKDNISVIESYGFECTIDWKPERWFNVYSNLSVNRSVIIDGEDNQGKVLPYSPGIMATLGIISNNPYLSTGVSIQYKGLQYTDDVNNNNIPSHAFVNVRISKKFAEHYNLSYTIQNLFDHTYLYDGHNLTLGRFMQAGFEYIF